MDKRKFKSIVKEGIDRGKDFMILKIRGEKDVNPRVIIVQGEDIGPTTSRYLKYTDDNMIFKDSKDKVEDVLLTNNFNDLFWFVY